MDHKSKYDTNTNTNNPWDDELLFFQFSSLLQIFLIVGFKKMKSFSFKVAEILCITESCPRLNNSPKDIYDRSFISIQFIILLG